MDNLNYYQKKRFVQLVQRKNIKVDDWNSMNKEMNIYFIDFKPQVQPQTTEKTTKKPKKSKRDADTPSKS